MCVFFDFLIIAKSSLILAYHFSALEAVKDSVEVDMG